MRVFVSLFLSLAATVATSSALAYPAVDPGLAQILNSPLESERPLTVALVHKNQFSLRMEALPVQAREREMIRNAEMAQLTTFRVLFGAAQAERSKVRYSRFWLANTVIVTAPARVIRTVLSNNEGLLLARPARLFHLVKPYNHGLVRPSAASPFTYGLTKLRIPDVRTQAKDIDGRGVKVGILDTGIDASHPDLQGKVLLFKDFIAGKPGPYDDHSHGTHVAGTIAAVTDASGFTGVAPQSKILAGRVCSAQGCSNIAIARGVNWGLAENVDVISMSLGGAWSTPAERDAITKATAQGITVVAASGNDGTNRISYPAALPEVIAVGAVDQNNRKAAFSQYGPELAIVAPGVEVVSTVPQGTGRESDVQVNVSATGAQRLTSVTFEGAADVPTPLENTMAYAGLGRPEDFAAADVRGKFALMARGEIKFIDKVQNAINAGAIGAIIFNNAPGLIHGALTQDGTKMSVPVFMIEQVPGESLRAALNAHQEVKARVAVIATDYAPLDGTSMATPHVTGVVALLKAANRALTPAQVKQILQKTALPLAPNDNNEFGAGMINAMAATGAAVQARNAPALP